MIKKMILAGAVFAVGCGGEQTHSGSEGSSRFDSGNAGSAGQPAFCDYAQELREVPTEPCDFTGICKIKVAYYCDEPQAANRKKYDCECVDGAYSCTPTEFGLSIDTSCVEK